jgi:hypothetical protein
MGVLISVSPFADYSEAKETKVPLRTGMEQPLLMIRGMTQQRFRRDTKCWTAA